MKNFYKFLLISFSIIFQTNFIQSQWVKTNYPDWSYELETKGELLFTESGNNIYLSVDYGDNWVVVTQCPQVFPNNVLALFTFETYLFAGVLNTGVYRSTNNGYNWVDVNNGLPVATISTFAANGLTLFAGSADNGVYSSSNNGTSWVPCSEGFQNETIQTIFAYNGNICASTGSAKVFISTDNSGSWVQSNLGLPSVPVTSFATIGNILFAATSMGVFKTTNNGTIWLPVNNGLTQTNTFALKSIGANLFVGTIGGGVYLSTNNGVIWQPVNEGFIDGIIYDFEILNQNLFVSGYNYGVYKRPLSEFVPSITLTFPNGGENWTVGTTHNIIWSSKIVLNVKIEYTTDNGTNWNTIIESTPAKTNFYNWTIPNVVSTACKIKISDADNPLLSDISENSFEIIAINNVPVVTNVDFNIRADGSKIVDIIYDVNDADGNNMTVTVTASSDSGVTWGLPITNITGAVGSGITSGIGKTIVWNTGVEHPNFYSPTVQIKITADDGVVNVCGNYAINYAGKIYNTILIGGQCWLKENLNVGTRIDGSIDQANNSAIEKYCYNNIEANCTTYGGLYQWNEAMNYSSSGNNVRGICPEGWHIPTLTEFETLEATVGSNSNTLKAIGQGTGTNTSGFTALLAGHRDNYGSYIYLDYATYFWSSTESDAPRAYYLHLTTENSYIYLLPNYKETGCSVRCCKD
ncbi:MAG: FISUMP domain-containing protein [bacterium]